MIDDPESPEGVAGFHIVAKFLDDVRFLRERIDKAIPRSG
jgi:hypothetical protein